MKQLLSTVKTFMLLSLHPRVLLKATNFIVRCSSLLLLGGNTVGRGSFKSLLASTSKFHRQASICPVLALATISLSSGQITSDIVKEAFTSLSRRTVAKALSVQTPLLTVNFILFVPDPAGKIVIGVCVVALMLS